MELGEALGVPAYSLDAIVWRPGWKKTPAEERAAAERALAAGPAWIIDGVSSTVRQASDLVLFLDVPAHRCARRALARSLRHLTSSRPGLPDGCPEWRIVPRLLQIIRRFPSGAGRQIREEAARDPARYRILRGPEQAMAAIDALGTTRSAQPDRILDPAAAR